MTRGSVCIYLQFSCYTPPRGELLCGPCQRMKPDYQQNDGKAIDPITSVSKYILRHAHPTHGRNCEIPFNSDMSDLMVLKLVDLYIK